jgi:hypothetical protein
MIHSLPAVAFCVDYKTPSLLFTPLLYRQFPRFVEQPADKGRVTGFHYQQVFNVLLWDEKEMNRSHRIDVAKGQHFIIFVNLFAGYFPGYYFTENAITHDPL